jgi:hypothetical protein
MNFKPGDLVKCIEHNPGWAIQQNHVYRVKRATNNKIYIGGHVEQSYSPKRFILVPAEPATPINPNAAGPKKATDTQVGGTHYTDLKIQPFELTYANFGYAGLKAAVYTKVNKYMTRSKDNEIQQLEKARHCLDILIEKAKETYVN